MSASSEREPMPQRQLGELMTELGLISEEQLATVLEVQQQSKRPLGQIIVELGFASGAAVAHALAMQSGGALKTEYGFALGIAPVDEEDGARGGLPKLRLAATAVAPPARPVVEPAEDSEPVDESAPATVEEHAEAAPAARVEEAEPVVEAEPVAEAEEIEKPEIDVSTAEPQEEAVVPEVEEGQEVEAEELLADAESSVEPPPAGVDPPELQQLRADAERLQAAL